MPDITPNLGLKKPLGNENVTRASYNENLDLIDTGAANIIKIVDTVNGSKYVWGIDNGQLFLEEVV